MGSCSYCSLLLLLLLLKNFQQKHSAVKTKKFHNVTLETNPISTDLNLNENAIDQPIPIEFHQEQDSDLEETKSIQVLHDVFDNQSISQKELAAGFWHVFSMDVLRKNL